MISIYSECLTLLLNFLLKEGDGSMRDKNRPERRNPLGDEWILTDDGRPLNESDKWKKLRGMSKDND